MLVTKKLLVSIDFHSISSPPIYVSGCQQAVWLPTLVKQSSFVFNSCKTFIFWVNYTSYAYEIYTDSILPWLFVQMGL